MQLVSVLRYYRSHTEHITIQRRVELSMSGHRSRPAARPSSPITNELREGNLSNEKANYLIYVLQVAPALFGIDMLLVSRKI